MALSVSQKNQIASYKIRIQEVRKQIDALRKHKKERTLHFNRIIAACKDANSKRDRRKMKINEMNNFSKSLDSKKNQLEHYKLLIKKIKN